MTVCTCGQGHATFGACVRAKNIRVGYCGIKSLDLTAQKKLDRELDAYADAKRQGVQPAGTSTAATQFAMEVSDRRGKAFDASKYGSDLLNDLS